CRLDWMHEKHGRRGGRNPSIDETDEQIKQQRRIRHVDGHVHNVIPRWVDAAKQVIQIKRKEGQLPQVKRIKEVRPLRRVGDVAVIGDQDIIEMKGMVKGRRKKQKARHNQTSLDFQRIWI